ncbi:MAG: ArsR/SmtB family transcription factor [Thermomicrobiales bacterium]|nr:ArsR family transcriptional regulator [Thermomicrobiales bacterium]
MRVIDVTAPTPPPAVVVEAAPAYELLLSFCASEVTAEHEAIAGPSDWTARLRALASPALRAEVAAFHAGYDRIWVRLLGLAYTSAPPKDVPALLAHLAALDPLELARMLWVEVTPNHERLVSAALFRRALTGDEAARQQVRDTLAPEAGEWRAALGSFLAREPGETKQRLLALLRRWYTEVFAPLEGEIVPILMRDAAAKRDLQRSLPYDRFIELSTNGIQYVTEPGVRQVVLIPSLVYRPWVLVAQYRDVKLIGHPVADENITTGDDVPPARLVMLYKALGDERRLHILKKLATETYTMQELADALGVAKSTMHHHLVALRVAGLVSVTSDADKRYTLRREAVPDAAALLQVYLTRASP